MISGLKRRFIENLKNIPGWRTKKKYVIIESDDWGSLRLDDKKHADKLLELGLIKQGPQAMSPYDGLESRPDFEALYDVLSSVKDSKGNSAVFTPFVNTGNPNFDKIRTSTDSELHYERFTDTYAKFGRESNLKLFHQGIDQGVFMPELHGHSHVCDWVWFESLKSSAKAKLGLEYNFASITLENQIGVLNGLRPTYFLRNQDDLDMAKKSLERAVKEFEEIVGYKATVFDAPNAIFHPTLEAHLSKFGIQTIVTQFYRNEPDLNGNLKRSGRYNFGQKNESGQLYHIRNCMFEPYKGTKAETTLRMIDTCFRWGKPAVISTHRVNYVSSVSSQVRDNTLKELKKILSTVVKRNPDVQFISSRELSAIMHNEIK